MPYQGPMIPAFCNRLNMTNLDQVERLKNVFKMHPVVCVRSEYICHVFTFLIEVITKTDRKMVVIVTIIADQDIV
jgi:hypothetical protein